MPAKGLLVLLLVLTIAAVCLAQAASTGDPELPASLERVTGNRAVSYAFFAVLAGLGLLLIFRGIRAR
jgi:hypothetical protein